MNAVLPNRAINQLDYSGKIKAQHLNRKAIIYIRQSTLQQVQRHQESTRLQYGLADKAVLLGWPRSDIEIIDEDLGCSGSTMAGRQGFQRLVTEVGLDHVGLVLGLEMSRLSRSSRDWYQLLEVCAIFSTLIGDMDGIYDPSLYNDRLLLGLKGTMSEAELHILKQRMLEGKRAKARRGELGMPVAMGFVRQLSGLIVKDPDEQAQSVIARVFDLFERKRTINGVLLELVSQQIQMPHRVSGGLNKGDLVWRRPNRVTLSNLLHNPIYAGAYAYGRRPTDPRKKIPGRPATGRTVAGINDWEVLIKAHHPAYISWSQYERNVRQLQANTAQAFGVVRKGAALLSGLLICGRCGLRMAPHYSKQAGQYRYCCDRMRLDYGEAACQSLAGLTLDDYVTAQIFKALQPAALEISLAAAEDQAAERQKQQKFWLQRLERAHIDTARAARQYHAVEPENRLVARTLERQWEETLNAELELKAHYEQFLQKQPAVLSEEERVAIRHLAQDIPTLWQAETTTAMDRQTIVRQLIERILVTVIDNTEKVQTEIHWYGGHITQAWLDRPVAKLEQMADYPAMMARVKELQSQGRTPAQIAEKLNSEGWKPPKRRQTFNAPMVRCLLNRQGIRIGTQKQQHTATIPLGADEWTLKALANELKMPEPTLYAWIKKGQVRARQIEVNARSFWIITANQHELEQLRKLRAVKRTWVKPAAEPID
ncbi:recombinase family protein [Methylicorpusculum sp.]|uniref:recombinase family protein n=1 Tax=Methylicorpusculum sp. TaxID=2713644 RepID=UPI00272029F6|nr:recombinase family protein [Methylicorpusculum sp.]MDO8844066.1 recombinase family protein [Methylicorpusculum sp.]